MTKSSPSNIKRRRRILVVDDEPDTTLTLKTMLENDGSFEVDRFNDPELALSNFKPGLYNLILVDFVMPKMSGYDLHDKIKKIDPKIKICSMSGTYVNYQEARKAFPSLDIECFIQKPVETRDLIRRINAELHNPR